MNTDVDIDVTLPDDLDTLKAMIRELFQQLRESKRELSGVRHRLELLLHRLYGPKSEKLNPNQPSLFDTSDTPKAPEPKAEELPVSKRPTRVRSGHGRKPLPADLPREQVIHDLSDAEKCCPDCQTPRVKIGEEKSEQLDYKPAKMFVREHIRFKYICTQCVESRLESPGKNASDTERTPLPIVIAPMPPQPIDKGLPGPGLLAHVVTSKYSDHLPLHRQEAILARHGVELSRSTLSDWMASVATLLMPLYTLMLTRALKSKVIQTDETRVPVLDPTSDKTKSGRLWVFESDRHVPYTVYDYTPTKARDGPEKILKDYKGFLQADAANVYDGIYASGDIIEVACWAHARRHFYEARETDRIRVAEALARIAGFYEIEDKVKSLIAKEKFEGDAADEVRLKYRQEFTKPKLDAFAAWLESELPKVLPKSPVGLAIAYARRHWQALIRFTDHGFLNIDNNAAERALRAVAVGRKNWLFAGSDNGGRTAAILFTFTQTCKRHNIDPFWYLRDVLTRLPENTTNLENFLPDAWTKSQKAST